MNWTPIIGIALWALIPGFIAKKKGRSFWGYYFLSFVITPLVTMIITICLSNLNSAMEPSQVIVTTASSTSTTNVDVVPSDTTLAKDNVLSDITTKNISPASASKIRFCRRCGFELIDGSEYCSRCGTEIEKEDHR